LLSGVSIAPNAVQLQFKRVCIRPEALLQIPPPIENRQFTVAEYSPEQVVFAAPQGAVTRRGLRAVVEQTFADDDAAVNALLNGDIDMLDRVPPWHVERLRSVKGIRIDSYKLPTVHVLIPNTNRALLAKREFRRALCFGIDRQWIVTSVLLGGKSEAGFEVLSGPFPAGVSLSDPVRYGYNNRIAPRPYEPRLAAILSTVAWASVNNPTGKKEDAPTELPEMPELTVAHPIDPVARVACQSIQEQLARAGIRIKLTEFTADQLLAGNVEADLRYAELAVWEPLTDARPLLAPGGLGGDLNSPYLQTALRQLDDASNWNEVRERLANIHDIAHHELPMIPLWQTVNFFAYRESLSGVGNAPVLLYQNIDNWTPSTVSNVARTDSTSQ
jgi:ABC-type transport system substrate-binding protein